MVISKVFSKIMLSFVVFIAFEAGLVSNSLNAAGLNSCSGLSSEFEKVNTEYLSGPATLSPNLPKQLVDRISSLNSKPFNFELLKGQWSDAGWSMYRGRQPGVAREGDLRLSYDGVHIALVGSHYRKGALRFDILVDEKFRGCKLYEYLLDQVLALSPETESIPARMPYGHSDNAKIVIDAVFGNEENFIATSSEKWTSNENLEFRRKVYDAMLTMPAYKARERNGFGKVSKVIFSPENKAFAFIVEKGSKSRQDEMKLYIQGSKIVEFLENGTQKEATIEEVSLGDYVDFDKW